MSRIACLVFLVLLTTAPVIAQTPACMPDLTPAMNSIKLAQVASDLEQTLAAIREAQATLQLAEAGCISRAVETQGQTRTNPVPFGSYGQVDHSRGLVDIVFTGYSDDAAQQLGETPEAGHRFVAVEATVVCREDVNGQCNIISGFFSAVGRKGIIYEGEITRHGQVEVFGGAQGTLTIPFEVDADDGDFVLYLSYPEVYFAAQPGSN